MAAIHGCLVELIEVEDISASESRTWLKPLLGIIDEKATESSFQTAIRSWDARDTSLQWGLSNDWSLWVPC